MEMEWKSPPSGGNRDVGLKNFARFLHHLDLYNKSSTKTEEKGKLTIHVLILFLRSVGPSKQGEDKQVLVFTKPLLRCTEEQDPPWNCD